MTLTCVDVWKLRVKTLGSFQLKRNLIATGALKFQHLKRQQSYINKAMISMTPFTFYKNIISSDFKKFKLMQSDSVKTGIKIQINKTVTEKIC